MEDYVITISRTFGSGGKRIGKKLAGKLGIRSYNIEIKDVASHKTSVDNISRMLQESDRRDFVGSEAQVFVPDQDVFDKQAKIINFLADSESCIIVGRCADYVLEGRPNVFRFFIDAPKEYRIGSIAKRLHIDEAEAAKMEESTSRYRKEFYEYYTGKVFGDPANYDICFDASKMEPDEIEEAILDYVISKLDVEE